MFSIRSLPTLSVLLLITASSAAAQNPPRRPQTPQPPFPYASRDITIAIANGAQLAGTLTIPNTDTPAPAVILVPGAGPTDRDNTIARHKPFLVLADHLARNGIATLRLDSRGVGASSASYTNATGNDLAADLIAALSHLQRIPEINPDKIGLVAHSEGGTVAAIAAAQSRSVKFLVLLAAPGLPDTDLFATRIAQAGKQKQLSAAAIENLQTRFRSARASMFKNAIDAETKNTFAEIVRLLLPAGAVPPPEALAAAVERQIAADSAPNRSFFLSHDPRKTLAHVRCPVLALAGTKDQNVPANENLAAIREALTSAGNRDLETATLDGLNHFFQTAITGSPLEVAQLEQTFAPQVLDLITKWIRTHKPRSQVGTAPLLP